MSQYSDPDLNEPATQLDDCVRENPTRSIFIALGVGLALGLLIRALQTPPATTRAARLMEDLHDRLHDLTNRATHLAGDGADRVRDLGIERRVRSVGQRLRELF